MVGGWADGLGMRVPRSFALNVFINSHARFFNQVTTIKLEDFNQVKSLQSSQVRRVQSSRFNQICSSSKILIKMVCGWAGGLGMHVPRTCATCFIAFVFSHVLILNSNHFKDFNQITTIKSSCLNLFNVPTYILYLLTKHCGTTTIFAVADGVRVRHPSKLTVLAS